MNGNHHDDDDDDISTVYTLYSVYKQTVVADRQTLVSSRLGRHNRQTTIYVEWTGVILILILMLILMLTLILGIFIPNIEKRETVSD